MELNDVLEVPLAPAALEAALREPALLRASLDRCEALERLAPHEFAATLVVPVGALRARYAVRAHVAAELAEPGAHQLDFIARADGFCAVRGRLELRVEPGASGGARLAFTVWASPRGACAEWPARQFDHALRTIFNDFFADFRASVLAKHGLAPNRAACAVPRAPHVFLRPALAQEAPGGGVRTPAEERAARRLPGWAWGALLVGLALFVFGIRWAGGAG